MTHDSAIGNIRRHWPPPPATVARVPAVLWLTLAGLLAGEEAFAQPRLALTVGPGTANCGSSGLTSPPAPPFSGELDSDTGGATKITDLGLGCLHFGGGKGTVIRPIGMPDGAVSYFDVQGATLAASSGTSSFDCTKGAGAGRHCINGSAGTGGGVCTADTQCGGVIGSCALDANCYFGPPVPVPSLPPLSALSSCLIDVVQTDAAGTIGATTGSLSVTLPLSSRLYITGNSASPCPRCLSGTCDPTWKTGNNTTSPDAGAPCTAVGSLRTSQQCRPTLANLQVPLPLDLTPLTTGTVSTTGAGGNFCPGQKNAGAFGQVTTQRILENGAPAGNLTDGATHATVLGSSFCIPSTGNAAVDGVVDLPGPGAISLNATAQLAGPPKVVCVNNTPTVSGPLTVRDVCTATEDTLGSFDALKMLLAAISVQDGGTTLRVSGINVQLVNGAGATDTTNGRGNLIVGYDANTGGHPRGGSHDVVVGDEHTYVSYGGLVGGFGNTIAGPGAAIIGGRDNSASGTYASISGGLKNRADGMGASVSGGEGNRSFALAGSISGGAGNLIGEADKAASISGGLDNRIDAKGAAFAASISGGSLNKASARAASVSGGTQNEATALAASVSGGANNVAGASGSRTIGAPEAPAGAPSVSGGFRNVASGAAASVTGGHTNTAGGLAASVAGGHTNTASSFGASVTGGSQNRATWTDASVSGGSGNEARGNAASISGGRNNLDSGPYSSISGGWANQATGQSAAVSGGLSNVAENDIASVSGGVENHASGYASWVGGGGVNQATDYITAVCGGEWNVADKSAAAVSGGSANLADGIDASVSGGDHNTAAAWAASVSGKCNRKAASSCGLEPGLQGPLGLFCPCDYGP